MKTEKQIRKQMAFAIRLAAAHRDRGDNAAADINELWVRALKWVLEEDKR